MYMSHHERTKLVPMTSFFKSSWKGLFKSNPSLPFCEQNPFSFMSFMPVFRVYKDVEAVLLYWGIIFNVFEFHLGNLPPIKATSVLWIPLPMFIAKWSCYLFLPNCSPQNYLQNVTGFDLKATRELIILAYLTYSKQTFLWLVVWEEKSPHMYVLCVFVHSESWLFTWSQSDIII